MRKTPAQDLVVLFASVYPGRALYQAARYAGPHGSLQYGYRAVYRAIAAGRVRVEPNPRTRGSRVLFSVEDRTNVQDR